jgi:hypothetical protein
MQREKFFNRPDAKFFSYALLMSRPSLHRVPLGGRSRLLKRRQWVSYRDTLDWIRPSAYICRMHLATNRKYLKASPCHLGFCDLPGALAPFLDCRAHRFGAIRGGLNNLQRCHFAPVRRAVFFVNAHECLAAAL